MIKTLSSFDVKEKRIVMRADLNVPMQNGKVTDDFRLQAVIPTIQHCLDQGASVVLMSHLGRPEGKVNKELSLIPVGETMADLLETPIKFSHDCIGEDAFNTSLGLNPCEVHLLENLRFHAEETDNDLYFSSQLAKHGDVFINDAFGTAHRRHASNVGIATHYKHKGMGFLMEKELLSLRDTFEHPKKPVVLILGGAKIDSKLKLINRFLNKANSIIIGGGMAFTFLKSQGYEIGSSLVQEDMLVIANQILKKAKDLNVNISLPKDFLCAKSVQDVGEGTFDKRNIPKNLMGLDIGSKSIERFGQIITSAKTVLWNGPMGVFEQPAFEKGTKAIAQFLVNATEHGCHTIVGGGDTASAIRTFGYDKNVSHVSTGGGASLELLSGKTLPAFTALEQS